MSPELITYLPLLFLVGVLAGFMNAVAGGASLVVFPVLVLLGLEPRVANATNNFGTTAVALQAFASYALRGVSNRALTVKLSVPAFLGAIAGALAVVALPKEVFTRVVGALMVLALGVVLYNPGKRKAGEGVAAPVSWKKTLLGQGLFLLLGIYGGFFGGGIGMLILPTLVLFFGQTYLTGNGVKTGVVAVMNLTATAIFLYHGMVDFAYALPLTGGMILGTELGVRAAVKGGDAFIRPLLVVVTLAAAVKFLFFP